MMTSRFDSRSKEEFQRDILQYTVREQWLWNLFLTELDFLGLRYTWEHNGCCNDGSFVENPTKAADYQITVNNTTKLLEIKLGSSPKFCTFKVSDLSSYIDQGSSILLFYSSSRFVRSISDLEEEKANLLWDVIGLDTMRRILQNHEPFRFSGLGGKLSVQVKKDNFEDYFNFRRLRHVTERSDPTG